MQPTIIGSLARAVAAIPNAQFLDVAGEGYTFGAFDRLTTEAAHGLRAAGVERGVPVSVLLDNTTELLVAWFAANKIGAIYAPINTAFKGDYLKAQLNDTAPTILVAHADYLPRLAQVAAEVPSLRRVYVAGSDRRWTEGQIDYCPYTDLSTGNFEPIPDETAPDETAVILYTSGTTGPAKGCMMSTAMLCASVAHGAASGRYRKDDVLWNCLPLFHSNAINSVMAALVTPCRVAVSRRFSVSNFWPEIERSGATTANLLGSMATLLANAPDNEAAGRCRGQLRTVLAIPFSPDDVAIWRERFGVNASGAFGYGLTEALRICGVEPGDPLPPPGSSGRGGVDFEVGIVDQDDNLLPPDSVGEIVCRPLRPNVLFKGYWRRPDATLRAWRNLWFHTGDLGRLDAQGWFYFVDRKNDYIRRRGENISSAEAERIFLAHPDIQDVAVHAVRSPLGEDEVKVTAERVAGSRLTEEALCRWSIERLPYFAVPLYIEFRDALPRTATGKVLKSELREEGKTPATWDRGAAGLAFERR